MRARLLGITLGLLTILAVALGVPVVTGHAERVTEDLFARRAADTRHLADVAESSMLTGRFTRLSAEMERYRLVYGVTAVALNADGQVLGQSKQTPDLSGVDRGRLRSAALAGRATEDYEVAWPWRAQRPLVIAVPIAGDGQVLGVVVTVSPTTKVRAAIRRNVAAVAAGGVGLFALAVLGIGLPVARWVLRPVHALDAATHEVAAGRPALAVDEAAGAPELRRLARSFNEMAAQVRVALEQQRDFVSQASHQLRNPLTVLRLSVDNLEEHVAPAGRAHLELAASETERLGAVVDRLLELARAEASSAEQVPVDVAAAAAARRAAWQDAYDLRGVPLALGRAGMAEEPVIARCDPEMIAHALDTLLDNALKYCEGAPVRIEVGPAPDGMIEMAVADAGPGLPAEDLPAVGDRFWRSPVHQNVDGTGLGLATARILVESAGGRMRVDAVAPHGLRVAFLLPRA